MESTQVFHLPDFIFFLSAAEKKLYFPFSLCLHATAVYHPPFPPLEKYIPS